MSFLAKRKYLDALCVYFWATTPILMSLLTFGTVTLLGSPLIASTTFASVALLNMLIGPLNAFPWIVNGLVEAWISLKRVQTLIDVIRAYNNKIKDIFLISFGCGMENFRNHMFFLFSYQTLI